jgi:hypothetical protein
MRWRMRVYRDWAAGQAPTSTNVAVATLEDLAANNFVIDPARYQAIDDAISDSEETTRTIATLHQRLDALIEASHSADDRLRAVLESKR